MKTNIFMLSVLAIILMACNTNDANEPVFSGDNNDKEIVIKVGTSHYGSGNQSSARKIFGQSVSPYDDNNQHPAGTSEDDFDHYCWQWEDGDIVTIKVENPSTQEIVTRTFHILEHGEYFYKFDTDGKTLIPCEQTDPGMIKNRSFDSWATFKGTMPAWWEDGMPFDVYAGPDQWPNEDHYIAPTADGFTNLMSFYGKVTGKLSSDPIILDPQRTIFIVQYKVTQSEDETTTPCKAHPTDWARARWNFHIPSLDLIISDDDALDVEDPVVFTSNVNKWVNSSVADFSSQLFNAYFILDPNDSRLNSGHLFMRLTIDENNSYIGDCPSGNPSDQTKSTLFDYTTISNSVKIGDLSKISFKDENGNGVGLACKFTLDTEIGLKQ